VQGKAKKNQGKILAFPCISLAELGLFKGLLRIQIKNLGLVSTRLSGCVPSLRRTSSWPPRFALLLLLGRARRIFDRFRLVRLVRWDLADLLQVLLHRRRYDLVDAEIGGDAVDLVDELLARLVVIDLVGACGTFK
jgi:hypothetical protein